MKNGSAVRIWSRNHKDMTHRFPEIAKAVGDLKPKSMVLDGELVCLDREGRPCFETLQDWSKGDAAGNLHYYAFDLLHLSGRDMRELPLIERKEMLRRVIADTKDPLRLSDCLNGQPEALVKFVKKHRLEGIVAKRADSRYESDQRSGAWVKYKVFQCARFKVGAFILGGSGVNALLVGTPGGETLRYAAKVQMCFPLDQRWELGHVLKRLEIPASPFRFVPLRKDNDTWSFGITHDELERCRWIKPHVEAEVEFIDQTSAGFLRQCRFKSFCV